MRHATLQRLADGGLQRPRAVAIQQARQRRGGRPQALAPLGGALQERPAGGRGLGQPVAGAVRPGGALVCDQGINVDGLLDLLTAVPAARVAGQFLRAVQEANPVFVGQHAQGPAHMGVRHRVVVQIEARIRCLANGDRHALFQRIVVLGQRQQARSLGFEGLAHAQARILRPAPVRGRAIAPAARLRVQVVQVGVRAGGEEVVANVAYGAFHPALLITARHRDRPRLVAVVTCERQQRGVEADRVAAALQHGALQVVVEHDPGAAAEGGEGLGVAADEGCAVGVEEEAQEDAARVAQHHDEGHQGAAGAADLQMAEVGPVDLRLLAGQRAQAQVGLGGRARAHVGHEVAQVRGAADVAALGQHAQQPRRGQRGEPSERLQDERPVRVDAARAQWPRVSRGAVAGDDAPHDIAVDMQLARDRAHAPLLDRMQAQDLRNQVRGCGHGATRWAASWPAWRGAGSLGGASRVAWLRSGGSGAPWGVPARRWWGRLWWRRCRVCMRPVEQRPPPTGNPGASLDVRGRRPALRGQ